MAKDIGLDPVGMGYVFSASHGLMLSGRSLVAGCWTVLVKTRLLLVDLYLVDVYLAARFVDIFSGFGIIVALFTLRFLSGLLKRHLSPATVALLRPGSGAGKGNGGVDF